MQTPARWLERTLERGWNGMSGAEYYAARYSRLWLKQYDGIPTVRMSDAEYKCRGYWASRASVEKSRESSDFVFPLDDSVIYPRPDTLEK